jgi:hypothetical protein
LERCPIPKRELSRLNLKFVLTGVKEMGIASLVIDATLTTVGHKVVVKWLGDMAKEKAEETPKEKEKERERRAVKEKAEEEEAGLKGIPLWSSRRNK